MFRFTIRELLLVTALVAVGAGWYADHRSLAPDAELQRYHAARTKLAIQELIDRRDQLKQSATLIEP
jgi:hypothetical protein